MIDLEKAHEKIILGLEKKSMIMNFKEYQKTAYHESGHALVATLLPHAEDPVHKLSIIPRGQALGVTIQIPRHDRYSVSQKYLNDQICILMAGRIAEEIIFNELSSGASNDFEKATGIAKQMVCNLGMSKRMGPISYNKEDLGKSMEIYSSNNYSENTAFLIDKEIYQIVKIQYNRSRYILEKNLHILHKLSKMLIKYETISGEELELIINSEKIFCHK